jgi:SAM-dependent methyltransferase
LTTTPGESVLTGLYEGRDRSYFGTPRLDLLGMLPRRPGLRTAEIGAGDGATLREAKRLLGAAYTVGLDLRSPAWESDDPWQPDLFLSGDLEADQPAIVQGDFDAVICGDVLEHLIDPWRTVRRLRDWLKPGGVIVASIPNFRNHRALRPILRHGTFRYENGGLLDRGHLRFFCRRNVIELFSQAGLVIDAVEENMGGYGRINRAIDALTLGRLHEFFVFQYRVRAARSST